MRTEYFPDRFWFLVLLFEPNRTQKYPNRTKNRSSSKWILWSLIQTTQNPKFPNRTNTPGLVRLWNQAKSNPTVTNSPLSMEKKAISLRHTHKGGNESHRERERERCWCFVNFRSLRLRSSNLRNNQVHCASAWLLSRFDFGRNLSEMIIMIMLNLRVL